MISLTDVFLSYIYKNVSIPNSSHFLRFKLIYVVESFLSPT